MTLTDIKKLVESVRYKPGWKISAEVSPKWNDVVIRIDARVRDSRRKGWVIIRATQWATTSTHGSMILKRIAKAVTDLEKHEFGEWFKVGKERPYDPHA